MSKLLSTLPQKPIDAETESTLSKSADKTELVMSAMREACLYMTKCCRAKLPEDEIFSLAYAALTKAAGNFIAGRGTRFMGYAKPYLRGEISRAWRTMDVVRSASMHESLEGIPEKFGNAEIRDSETGYPIPDSAVGIVEETLGACFGSVDPEFELVDLNEKWALIQPIIEKQLNDHEKLVLNLHYKAGLTFVEISKMVVPKVSRERIRQIESTALRKIRNALLRAKRLYSEHC